MTTVTINLFDVTDRCPVCAGAAKARYRGSQTSAAPRRRRKCGDCGFTWDETAVSPNDPVSTDDSFSPDGAAERSPSPG
jgi:hypothetical protein